MSVRKRTWTTGKGEAREAWVVDYVDQQGARHIETFDRKKDADAYEATVRVDVRKGVHTAPSKSPTVEEAARKWIAAKTPEWERTTRDTYQSHVDLHIVPYLGRTKLAQLTVPMAREFQDNLRTGAPAPGDNAVNPRSDAMTRKIMTTFGAILADAQERGDVAQNVVYSLRKGRRRGQERQAEKRAKGKLKIGVDIPLPDEVRAVLGAAQGRWRPLLFTAIFTGLRASELRGLRWQDVDLKKATVHVAQRADRHGDMGAPKSEAGERTVPMPPSLVSVLREWKLACPKGELGLVFPNGQGNPERRENIVRRGLEPTMLRAGVSVRAVDGKGKPQNDDNGKPITLPKYTGMHALRHFYASWCINRKVDGGLELPPKVVQHRLGHASITITMDTYGHLFPSADDGAELAEAERALLG